ncbi:MAG TPA: hypothetical protein VFR37_24860, partial [Longimicrobium sp.]|nr:hypothetical protein [Longimicrobium sp.]
MALDDHRYEQLCRAIEARSAVPLSRENREILRTFTPEAADQFMAVLETPYEQTAADDQASSGVPWWFIAAVLAPALALTGLWGWFAPFTNQTPVVIKVLIIVVAVACLAAGLVLDLMMRRFYVSYAFGVVL